MERFGVDEKTARRRMHETDANGTAYIRQVDGHDWRDVRMYDLILNTDRLGYERTAAVILAAVSGPLPRPGH